MVSRMLHDLCLMIDDTHVAIFIQYLKTSIR